MKYANRLSNKELKEIYNLFIGTDCKINELHIIRDDESIGLEGYIEIPEYEEERLKENPDARIILDDNYEITDYFVKIYSHSGDCTKDYRKYMYKKFGNKYAKDYLFNN